MKSWVNKFFKNRLFKILGEIIKLLIFALAFGKPIVAKLDVYIFIVASISKDKYFNIYKGL